MKCLGWINQATTDCKYVPSTISEACSEWLKTAKKDCDDQIDQAVQTCVDEVDETKKECVEWADNTSKKCDEWADEGSKECTDWKDEGWEKCTDWEDEGYEQCQASADYGHSACTKVEDWGHSVCCDWKPCKWFCKALVWVAHLVCTATVWIANVVCTLSYWIASWVCKAGYWFANLVCQVWYWFANWVCQAWTILVSSSCVAWAYGTKLVCKGSGAVAKSACTIFLFANAFCQITTWILSTACGALGWFAKALCLIFTFAVCTVNDVINRVVGRAVDGRIKHVFVLMLENRSFDHMLGFARLKGVDPRTGAAVMLDDTPVSAFNLRKDGMTKVHASVDAPFKLGEHDGPPHEFPQVVQQLCGLAATYDPSQPYPPITMNGFVETNEADGSPTPENVMRCFRPATLPVLHTLAKEYAVCDNWFSSLPGPTWPNRFFVHAATSGGLDGSPDFADTVGAIVDGYHFEHGTIYDRLEENCIDWQIFEGDETPQCINISGMTFYALMQRFSDLEDFGEKINSKSPPAYAFIEPDYGHVLPGGHANDYTCGNSQHPIDDVTRGEWMIKSVYEKLRASKIWNDSVLIITYDEHGGFWDHVVPPSDGVPPGDVTVPAYSQHQFDFRQLGVRVPAVIVSPLIAQGTIDHTRFDHTSILATAERIFGLAPLTERDKAANDLLHLFTLPQPRTDMPAIPNPPESGFKCENDETHLGEVGSGLTTVPEDEHAPDVDERDAATMERSLWGFLHVAAQRDYSRAPYPERRRLRERYEAVQTKQEAMQLMQEAKLRLRKERRTRRAVRRAGREELARRSSP
jgi:phospholipase C